jgi:hypothetical protein
MALPFRHSAPSQGRFDRAHAAHPRYAVAVACAIAAALALCAPAMAQGPLPPNNGGSTQYIPPRPDPGGDKPANPASPSRPDRLPANVRGSLPSGREGELLTRFATSPGYGAPSDEPRGGTGKKGDGSGAGEGVDGSSPASRHKVLDEGGGTAASAVTSAASDTGVAVLIAALVALTLATLAVARSRRKRSGDA